MLFSAVWAYFMPPVMNSVYFHSAKFQQTDQPTSLTSESPCAVQVSTTSEVIESKRPKKEVNISISIKNHIRKL